MLFFFKVMPRFHLFTVYVIHCHIQMEKYLKTSLAPFLYIDMYDEKCQKYNFSNTMHDVFYGSIGVEIDPLRYNGKVA